MEESGKGLQQLLWGIRKSISNKWRDCRKAPREDPAATEDQFLIPLPVNLLAAAKGEMCSLNSAKEHPNNTQKMWPRITKTIKEYTNASTNLSPACLF